MSDDPIEVGSFSAASQRTDEKHGDSRAVPADASRSELHDGCCNGDEEDEDDDGGGHGHDHFHGGHGGHSHSHEHGACSGHHGGSSSDAGSGYDEDDGNDDAFAPPGAAALRYMTLAQLRSCLKDGGSDLVDSDGGYARGTQSTDAIDSGVRAATERLLSSPNQIMVDLAESVDFASPDPPRSFASLADARRFRRAIADMITEAIHLLDVFDHFAAYGQDARATLAREERQFAKIDWKMRAVLGDLRSKFAQREECIDTNQEFLNELLRTQGLTPWHVDFTRVRRLLPPGRRLPNADKVRSALRQCARDWSSAGAAERAQTYTPLLAALEEAFPDAATRGQHTVLVPGTGLSRLHYEIALRGFGASACEFSYYMLLPAFYLLNQVERAEQWTIYPWVGGSGNLRKAADRVAPVKIPDVACGSVPLSPDASRLFAMTAGDFTEVVGNTSGESYDAVVTCFFIDTAHNVLEYLRIISHCLKPGGKWINLGPLLYHYADMPNEVSIELAWDEIKAAMVSFGFSLDSERFDVQTTYAGAPETLMSTVYNCVFSVATKTSNTTPTGGWEPTVLGAILDAGRQQQQKQQQQQHMMQAQAQAQTSQAADQPQQP